MTGMTVDELWQMFKATDERMALLNKRLSEEAARNRAETEALLRRLAEEGARNRAWAEASRRETEESQRKTEESQRKTEESQRKTEAALRELSRKMGDLSNRLGDFVEDMVVPAAKRLFLDRGIPVHQTARNVEASFDGRKVEFDILVVNADHVLVVEVKSRPKVEHVDELVERLQAFKRFLPRYDDCKAMGAIAGLSLDEAVARYAYRQGLFVLGQSGETVVILNDGKFEPKVW